MGVLYFIVALGFLVMIHEMGHLIVAKWCGIYAETFSIGFGPRLFSFRWGETEYQISLIPFGGYVKFHGEDPKTPEARDPRSFSAKKVWQRFLVAIAGPAMNIGFAFFIIPFVFMAGKGEPKFLEEAPLVQALRVNSPATKAGVQVGDKILKIDGRALATWREVDNFIILNPEQKVVLTLDRAGSELDLDVFIGTDPESKAGTLGLEPFQFIGDVPLISSVSPASPAAKAGLEVGDRIIAIGEKSVTRWSEMATLIAESKTQELVLQVERWREGQGILQTVLVTPVFNPDLGHPALGIGREIKNDEFLIKKYPVGEAFLQGWAEMARLTQMTFAIVGKLFTLDLSLKAIGGPIRIAQGVSSAAETGLSTFLYFVAFLSLQLGVLNLLPLPVLDGGHVVYLALEKIFRRPVSLGLRSVIDQAGFVLLVTLMLVVTVNDVRALVDFGFWIQKIREVF